MTTGKRVIFTGGSGKAGRFAVQYLVERGYDVLNLDLAAFPDKSLGVHTLKTDLTKSGQVFNAFTSHIKFSDFDLDTKPGAPDAVVHFAAIPSYNEAPDNATFELNTISTYNVIEAAAKLGVKKVIIASSETTYGVCFAQGDVDFDYFPLDEDYDVNPVDSYALSKVAGEKIARSFAKKHGIDIYCLRIGNVIIPEDYKTIFPKFVNNPLRKRNAWSYIDARDLAQIVHLSILKDGLGYQVFNATNDTITATVPTKEWLQKVTPQIKIVRELGEFEGPLSNKKIRDVLGFREQHNWRQYVTL